MADIAQRNRSTKIIATLGPASSAPETIASLHTAGADLFRLNFSHGAHEDHLASLQAIREVEQSAGVPIGVMADLQGPKIRIGTIDGGGIDLADGATYRFDLTDRPGDEKRAPLPHPEVFAALEEGMDLLIDDGRLRLTVGKIGDDFADCEVVTGGHLSDRKGVNLPQALLPMGAMTAKDQADLLFAL
ncbi:MAG: pyruvate kinase, partial [Alphaproteobacteria bacterium]|nr:pyruvate kinase [Alphaproteobacteria bacterium]